MRLLCDDHQLCLAQRPFAGGRGASLYLGDGDPAADPGPTCILYRRNRILDGADQIIPLGNILVLGGSSVPKTPAVAQVSQPTAELDYSLPDFLHGRVVWAQVRTFAGDVENETIYRPRRIVLDDAGAADNRILGTATLGSLEKRDGGGLLVRFVFQASRDGQQPTQFVLTRTAGPTSPSPTVIPAVAGQRNYEIEIAGLQDAGAYTFTLRAEGATASADLLTGINFTADAAGPTGLSNLIAVES